MILIDKLHKYFEKEFNLSELDGIKLKYSLEIIFSELSKLFILFTLFSILRKKTDFIYSFLTLFLIRTFTGGLHFKTYGKCLIFSGLFFYISIFLKDFISVNFTIISILFIFSLFPIIMFAPITHKSRPSYSYKKKKQFKIISIILVSSHFLICFFADKSPYFINSIWVTTLQSIQLLIAKGGNLYGKKKFLQKTI
ncbi:MAG: accessory gene regulator B family protein [Clostridiaceae bacterium]|nr:accessory gene regulator B family protein [Clostridiaceae bacterium]MBW4860407.1 accessory gene regulator B family protein [Clostridiaceae bacterium]MBW4868323.1 accessory gene regulator B family protein [Clostridiaceae bacterium]